MTTPLETPPNWPRLVISIDAAAGTVTLAETTTPVAGASLDDTRLHALEIAIAHAVRIGRPLYAAAHDPAGSWPFVVHPDGRVQDRERVGRRGLWTALLVAAVTVISMIAASLGVRIL